MNATAGGAKRSMGTPSDAAVPLSSLAEIDVDEGTQTPLSTVSSGAESSDDRYSSSIPLRQRKRSVGNAGSPPPEVDELARAEDRISFVYFEHCTVARKDNAVTVTNDEGVIHIPAARLSVLMLGPGSRVTHQAMTVLGVNGVTVLWVGEQGIRMYACGRPLTHSSTLLQKQAALVSNTRTRLRVARMMYQMRFPNEDVLGLTMQQLRGREGARIRKVYRALSHETGVAWNQRTYDHEDFDAGDDINKALSAANTCLYGVAHAVIVSLGCSPGLGFVHTGHERSFVYDIADLYKAEISIPVAFHTVQAESVDIGSDVRRNMRDALYGGSLLPRMVHDIKYLLGEGNDGSSAIGDEEDATDHVGLWDDKRGEVSAGRSYGREMDDSDEDDDDFGIADDEQVVSYTPGRDADGGR